MCIAGEEEPTGSSATPGSDGGGGGGAIPEIVVTAPRIGLDQELLGSIDWSEVAPLTVIGGLAGLQGGAAGALTGALAGAAAAIEGQDDVDLVDLVELKNDMVVIEGLPGAYVPLY